MVENHPIRLDLIFLFGISKDKSRLVARVLSLHGAMERVIDEVYKVKNKALPENPTFYKKISIIRNKDFRNYLRGLNEARNLCAHRSPNFHEEKITPILHRLEKIILSVESKHPDIYLSAEKHFSSRASAAIYTVMHLMAEEYGLEISDPIILDGLCYPNEKTTSDKINDIIGQL